MTEPEPDAPVGVTAPDLGWSLSVILRKWHERVELALEALPHGTRGFEILSVIGQGEPPTQTGLAKYLNIDKTVLPYVLDSLESAGLLERRVTPRTDEPSASSSRRAAHPSCVNSRPPCTRPNRRRSGASIPTSGRRSSIRRSASRSRSMAHPRRMPVPTRSMASPCRASRLASDAPHVDLVWPTYSLSNGINRLGRTLTLAAPNVRP